MDDRSVTVSPKPKRTISFEVSQEEATRVSRWLKDALDARINTPWDSQAVRPVYAAFKAVAEDREYGGH